MPYVLLGLAVLLIAVILANVRVVPQAYSYVVERFGSYHTTWEAGLHVKLPVIDHIARKVSRKEQVLDFAPQPVITKDNVTMMIDSVVYANVFSPKDYTYGVENALLGLQNLTATTLRSIIGSMELDATLSSRVEINNRMQVTLDEATDAWGLKVTRVEIKNIQPPKEIEEVMQKQMRAERERRQTLLEAEAHRDSSIMRAEGQSQAKILTAQAERQAQHELAEGRADALRIVSAAEAESLKLLSEANPTAAILRLKSIQAMKDIADGQATKIFVPNDLASNLVAGGMFGEMLGTAQPVQKATPRQELRRNAVQAMAGNMLEQDDCLTKPGVTEATKSSAADGARMEAATILRATHGQGGRVVKSLDNPDGSM